MNIYDDGVVVYMKKSNERQQSCCNQSMGCFV